MPFESDSFNIGENTLMEIERQAIDTVANTPCITNSFQQAKVGAINSRSPIANENVKSFSSKNLNERFKNASQMAKSRRKLEKSKSSSSIASNTRDNIVDISSISKYLQAEEIDFSAWENSAAKLISPAGLSRNSEIQRPTDFSSLLFDESNSEDFIESILSHNSSHQGLNISAHSTTHEENFEQAFQEHKSFLESSHNESIIRAQSMSRRNLDLPNQSLNLDTTTNLRLISNWNLPSSVVNEYKKKGVVEMFEWQTECLNNQKVLFEGCNLVYSAPTSAGKTLVSEILMIKNIIERKKKSLFVVPFVSIVREKMFYLREILESSGIRVDGFFGGHHPPGGMDSVQLAVCTIEKANNIINRLLEQEKLSEIGMIVIDEVHLIGDQSRGYITELLLTKVLYWCKKFQHKIQIVTMSATLPNDDLLRKWLDAEYYTTDFRPIELTEMIKIDNSLYDREMNPLRVTENRWKDFFTNDIDQVCELAMETLMENCQLVIFCPTKDWCEQLCTNLARGIHNILKVKGDIMENIIDKARLKILLGQMKNLPFGVDQVLQKSLAYGCAYHHAGITTDERDFVEMGFKDGTLRVLVATTTLSSGVNLPARRVIIRTPMFGNKVMSNLAYRQMIGRAGRKGKDVLGESILICSKETSTAGKSLLNLPLQHLSSALDSDNYAHFKRALLEVVASGTASSMHDIESFINSTLFCQQHGIAFNFSQNDCDETSKVVPRSPQNSKDEATQKSKDPIKAAMDFLLEFEFIRRHQNSESNEIQFVPTRLGLACLSSSISPKEGFVLFSELQKARQNFVLESELHAIYLVTPSSVANQLQIDWLHFAEMHDALSDKMKRVASLVGVSEKYLIKGITGKLPNDWSAQQIHKRFYTALALQELVNETPILEVSQKFKIQRGVLQGLQQIASSFAGIVTTFCKSLQWHLLAVILEQFQERLYFGIHPDLIELMKIPSMTSRIARSFNKNGIQKLSKLAASRKAVVENILIDLGDDFFVMGKSLKYSTSELSDMLITDARNHIRSELGLQEVMWNDSSLDDNPGETPKVKNQNNKRKAHTPSEEPQIKRKFAHPESSAYKSKLRSSRDLSDETEKPPVSTGESANQRIHLPTLEIDDFNSEVFENFTKTILAQREVGMSLGIQKLQELTRVIGESRRQEAKEDRHFTFDENFAIACLCFYYGDNQVVCLNLEASDAKAVEKLERFLKNFFSRSNFTLNIFEAREQLKILTKSLKTKLNLKMKVHDPRLASWMLDPDSDLTWEEMVTEFSPEHLNTLKAAVARSTVKSLGLNHSSAVQPKVRAAVECSLTNVLITRLLEKMNDKAKGLLAKVFLDLEMPIQKVLLQMELEGFPIKVNKLESLIEKSTQVQRQLEQHIFELNGRKFNLSSINEVAQAVGIHKDYKKQKISTAKQVLEKLDSPIARCIMSWRTLTTTISNIQPMINFVADRKKHRIHCNSFSLTQTGRISMYEPNLQNVTKEFHVSYDDKNGARVDHKISFRRVFECDDTKVLLSADFCQLEMRVLTHLCKDPSLVEIMNSPGEDIFKNIASKWNKIEESKVTDTQRNQTKQICYGILYGMGHKALSESLSVDEETSKILADEFQAAYPGINLFKAKLLENVRSKGYVETVTSRRRYFPTINSKTLSVRSQAERRAFNSCIQGSASDLVKNAMLKMNKNIHQGNLGGCEFVLHLHDELIYEIPKDKLKEAAKLLVASMENCVKLSIPLKVKVKSGQNWGDMREVIDL